MGFSKIWNARVWIVVLMQTVVEAVKRINTISKDTSFLMWVILSRFGNIGYQDQNLVKIQKSNKGDGFLIFCLVGDYEMSFGNFVLGL